MFFFRKEKIVDLQLPEISKDFPRVVSTSEPHQVELPVKRFKEKKVDSLNINEPGTFKKRKIAKGNVRKHQTDD